VCSLGPPWTTPAITVTAAWSHTDGLGQLSFDCRFCQQLGAWSDHDQVPEHGALLPEEDLSVRSNAMVTFDW
jgi:hypothetical protein